MGVVYIRYLLQARVLLAEWYLSAGEMEQCEQQCVALIKKDPSNDSASMVSTQSQTCKIICLL